MAGTRIEWINDICRKREFSEKDIANLEHHYAYFTDLEKRYGADSDWKKCISNIKAALADVGVMG